jgi:hypothetical protein
MSTPADDGEAIAREVLKEDADHDRGVRQEWAAHEGWHRREDTGRFGAADRKRAAVRDAEAKKKKIYHKGWEHEADAAAEALMARPALVQTPPPSAAEWRGSAYYAAGGAAALLLGFLCYYRRRRRRRSGLVAQLSSELLVDLEEAVVDVVGGAPKDD